MFFLMSYLYLKIVGRIRLINMRILKNILRFCEMVYEVKMFVVRIDKNLFLFLRVVFLFLYLIYDICVFKIYIYKYVWCILDVSN